MTREEAKQAIKVLQAYTEGKTVQIKIGEQWVDHDEPRFNLGPEHYRVKDENHPDC